MYKLKGKGGKLREGERHERFLDDYYRTAFAVRPASRDEQRRGIDRHFTDRRNGRHYTVEYKADTTAPSTGNAFIETVSVSKPGRQKAGWAYTCQADFLIYYVVGVGPAYVIRPEAIRRRLDTWAAKYEERAIPNDGYHTIGLLVPLDELERIAYAVSEV